MTADPDRIYDTLLIGTGPPMLFQGVALAEAGQSVILADAAPAPGGSWHLPEVLGYRAVEVGCHLIENRAYIHRVIEALLPEAEIARDTSDFGLWRGRRIPMRSARVLLYALVAAKSALALKGERTLHSLANVGLSLRYLGLPILYPRRGYGAVMEAALTRLDAAGAEVRQGARIERVHIGEGGITAETAGGPIRARHLVMSSRAHAPIAGMEALWEACIRVRTYSAVLHLEGPAPLFDGYVEVIGHPVIKRVRNTTRFAVPPVAPGRSLLTVQYRHEPETDDPGALADKARHWLEKLGLLAPGTTILGLHKDYFDLATLPARSLAEIARRHGPRVTILKTVDLGDQSYDLGPPPHR